MAYLDARGDELVSLASEVREMDRRTIEELGVPGRVLMELAGAGATRVAIERCGGRPGRAVVLCGSGNNGGDGYVIARHLVDAGWTARCVSVGDPAGLGADAAANHALWLALGGEVRVIKPDAPRVTASTSSWLGHADLIVDALFGTGLARPLEGIWAAVVDAANDKTYGLKLAVDVPSGVHADSGAVLGTAFRADVTATFATSKLGLLQHPGADCAGEVVVVDIGIPRAVAAAVGSSWRRARAEVVARLLPERLPDSHKGTFGHVGVVGGAAGREGAAVLAGLGALRAGAGLVTWNRPHEASGASAGAATRPPEFMTHDATTALDPRSETLVVGPGLGTGDEAQRVLDMALASGRRLVLDADALTLVAARSGLTLPGVVLTPHPREAARLLGVATGEVQADRPAAVRALADRYGACVLLKGAATLVAEPGGAPGHVIAIAEPTLATGGTGDVLAGAIGALMGAGLEARDAAVAAAVVHGLAGRRAGAQRAQRGALASEIAAALPEVMHELRSGWT